MDLTKVKGFLSFGILWIGLFGPSLCVLARPALSDNNVELSTDADTARNKLTGWIHKDAMQIVQPNIQEALGKELLGITPPPNKKGDVYFQYIDKVRTGLEQKFLSLNSFDRDTQSCLMKWAEFETLDPKIKKVFEKKGVKVSRDSGKAYVDSYLLKNYPDTSCGKQVAFDKGYFLQTLPECEDISLEDFEKMLKSAERPLQLKDSLSKKEKALAFANIAYVGEWGWESMQARVPKSADLFRKRALVALQRLRELFPETKKWDDIRVKALLQNVGSVMQDCAVPGD